MTARETDVRPKPKTLQIRNKTGSKRSVDFWGVHEKQHKGTRESNSCFGINPDPVITCTVKITHQYMRRHGSCDSCSKLPGMLQLENKHEVEVQ